MLNVRLTIYNNINKEEIKSIRIKLPKQEQELKKDFAELNLNYENLKENETRIKDIRIFVDDEKEAKNTRTMMDNETISIIGLLLDEIIKKADTNGINTSYNKLEEIYKLLESKTKPELVKIEMMLELEMDNINNLQEAIGIIKRDNEYNYYPHVTGKDDFAKMKIEEEYPNDLWLINYLDLYKLGRDITNNANYKYTVQGLIEKKENIQEIKKVMKKKQKIKKRYKNINYELEE